MRLAVLAVGLPVGPKCAPGALGASLSWGNPLIPAPHVDGGWGSWWKTPRKVNAPSGGRASPAAAAVATPPPPPLSAPVAADVPPNPPATPSPEPGEGMTPNPIIPAPAAAPAAMPATPPVVITKGRGGTLVGPLLKPKAACRAACRCCILCVGLALFTHVIWQSKHQLMTASMYSMGHNP
jgi:hypothetical protein